MVTIDQIREAVLKYLAHGDANRFVLDFSRLSYNIHTNGDSDAQLIADRIESKLADVRAGFASKDDLLEFVSTLVNPYVANNFVSVVFFQAPTHPVNLSAELGTACPAWVGFSGTSLAKVS